MFRVLGSFKVPHTISYNFATVQNSDPPAQPTGTPLVIPLDKVCVTFSNSDAPPALYDKELLCRLTFFRKLFGKENVGMAESAVRNVACEEFDVAALELVIGFVIDRMALEDLASPETLNNPALFEELERMLLYFAADEASEIIQDIKENHFPFINLETAEQVLSEWSKVKMETQATANIPAAAAASAALPARAPSADLEEQTPFAVMQAQKILIRSFYFKNKAEASASLQAIKDYQMEIAALQKTIRSLQTTLASASVSHTTTQRQLTEGAINAWSAMSEECKRKQKTEQNRSDPAQASIQQHFHLSQMAEHADPQIRQAALMSRQIVETYKAEILQVLTKSGADMTRADLLSYLIGPDAFLLDYYGMACNEQVSKPAFPFHYKADLMSHSRHFGYDLNQPSPAALEKEIRSDLLNSVFRGRDDKLPPVFIKDETITQPITPELEYMRCNILPKMAMWDSLAPEEQKTIKTRIIQHNKWNEYDIQPDDIVFNAREPNADIVRGNLQKPNRHDRIELNCINFELVILDGTINPNKVTSHTYLNRLHSQQFPTYLDE